MGLSRRTLRIAIAFLSLYMVFMALVFLFPEKILSQIVTANDYVGLRWEPVLPGKSYGIKEREWPEPTYWAGEPGDDVTPCRCPPIESDFVECPSLTPHSTMLGGEQNKSLTRGATKNKMIEDEAGGAWMNR